MCYAPEQKPSERNDVPLPLAGECNTCFSLSTAWFCSIAFCICANRSFFNSFSFRGPSSDTSLAEISKSGYKLMVRTTMCALHPIFLVPCSRVLFLHGRSFLYCTPNWQSIFLMADTRNGVLLNCSTLPSIVWLQKSRVLWSCMDKNKSIITNYTQWWI